MKDLKAAIEALDRHRQWLESMLKRLDECETGPEDSYVCDPVHVEVTMCNRLPGDVVGFHALAQFVVEPGLTVMVEDCNSDELGTEAKAVCNRLREALVTGGRKC